MNFCASHHYTKSRSLTTSASIILPLILHAHSNSLFCFGGDNRNQNQCLRQSESHLAGIRRKPCATREAPKGALMWRDNRNQNQCLRQSESHLAGNRRKLSRRAGALMWRDNWNQNQCLRQSESYLAGNRRKPCATREALNVPPSLHVVLIRRRCPAKTKEGVHSNSLFCFWWRQLESNQ